MKTEYYNRKIPGDMEKNILVLQDASTPLSAITQKLSENGCTVRVFEIASDVSAAIDEGRAELLIAATNYDIAVVLADKIHDKWQAPTFLVLAGAGDQTQATLRRHPGIIGVFYKPLNVEKLYQRAVQFLATL
jgi:DNA-binding NtrC family response regulator